MYGPGRMGYAGRGWGMTPRGGYGWRGGPVVGLAVVAVLFLAVASQGFFPFVLFFWWVIPAFLVPAVVLSVRSVSGLFEERSRLPMDEGRKEKELLEVLARNGEITPTRAALETSLSVSEADRMLSDLAKEGHVEVWAREGQLGYALWEHDRKEIE